MKSRWLLGVAALLCMAPLVRADISTQLYDTQTKRATSTTIQSDTALWTPASGFVFVLQGCMIAADAAQVVDFEVSDVDVITPVYLPSNGTVVIQSGGASIYTSAVDAVMNFSTATGAITSITCWGFERRS